MIRITATLSVLSDRVNPDQMTHVLTVTPDNTVLKGIDRVPPRTVPASYGWYITCVREGDPTANDTISELLDRLDSVHLDLDKLRMIDPNLRVVINVSVLGYSKDVNLFFPFDTISRIVKHGGCFDIEFFEP